jgi:hypothetical protein
MHSTASGQSSVQDSWRFFCFLKQTHHTSRESTMHRFTYVALTGCFVFLAPSMTHAVTLQYTGNAFTATAGAGPGNITATVDFLTPLTNGATLGPADVSSFTITGPAGTIDSGSATFAALEFIIGPSLTPTLWTMSVEQQLTGGAAVENYITHAGPTSFFGGGVFSFDIYVVDDTAPGNPGQNSAFVSSNSELPGTWTAVPEPTSIVMLGLGLIGSLAFVRRRKRNAARPNEIRT